VAGGIFLMKRGLPIRGLRTGENQLHLLETKVLGNRQFLVVVKYEDNKMLLGVGPGQIQYLCPLDSADDDMERLVRKSGPTGGLEQP
jgi:flagellar protein FliO/FliZ